MKKFNVVLIGFFDQNGKIMLNRRKDAPEEMWELIGGGIEENESPEDAIVREVFEELQYTIDKDKDELRLDDNFKLETDTFSADVHYFTAKFPGKDKFADSEETLVEDLELFPVEESLALTLLPMTRRILER
jgi:8-oxo-dGTP pyrophosphatase MutT (NUDIX family)